jgi:FKBP-type peptidyl-prolyl cis-trans isomerase
MADLVIEDLKVGAGTEAVAGKTVTVHYTGTLTDGKKFDSSHDHSKQGFTFKLGEGEVIQGWDRGVAGMKIGGRRKLTIPSDLAYGARGYGKIIPPHSTLIFDVELLDVR